MRIAIADDHPAVLAGVCHLLKNYVPEVEIVWTAKDSTELIELVSETTCDLLITDYVMPNGKYGDGISLLSFLRRRFPDLKIIVFTMISSGNIVAALMELGIHAVLSKGDDIKGLLSIISTVKANAKPGASTPVARNEISPESQRILSVLSKREFEVFRLFISGKSITEIALMLHRSKQTVSSQKMSAMHKLGIASDADLYKFACERRLADLSAS
jgi:two-component system, NarL family, captular synthesis response regulator RcsB